MDNPMDSRREIIRLLHEHGLNAPEDLTLMITNGCNLRCAHCLPQSGPSGSASQVPADALLRVIGDFAELNCRSLCITGGEPLTHPDWLEVLQAASRLNRFEEIRLQTNGTLLTPEAVSGLSSLKNPGLSIQVSLEGSHPESHDLVRGKGSFRKTLDGIRLLCQAGFGDQTSLAVTETRHNCDELPRILELAMELGVNRVVSGTLVSAGRARQNDRMSPPSPDQYRRLIGRYQADSRFRAVYDRIGNIAAIEWFIHRTQPGNGCCELIKKPYITADGRMHPCLMNLDTAYAATGVFQTPLETVIRKHAEHWKALQEISVLRAKTLEDCQDCSGKIHCAGGCLGRAIAATGDPMTVEDRCALRRAVYDAESS
jgi:radical SAM protein with 4Fe4S-binding SPASM domain